MVVKERNFCLDYLKGIACMGVVFFHVKMPNYYIDGIIQAMLRWAVPLFFAVSGYYCVMKPDDDVNKKMIKKIKHIFIINVLAGLYYFLFQMMIAMFGDSHGGINAIWGHLGVLFNRTTMVKWIVFNQDPFVHILWFISALLYCYIVMWAVVKWKLYKIFYYLIPILIIVHLFLGNVLYLFGIDTNMLLYRNFVLFGIPLFMLGHYIRHKEDGLKVKISARNCRVYIVGGTLLSVIEWFIFSRQEMFVGSLITLIGLFVWTLHYPEHKKNSFITVIGQKYSLFIYITHVSVSVVLDRFVGEPLMAYEKIYAVYRFANVLIVFVICLLGGMIFNRLLELLKIRGAK